MYAGFNLINQLSDELLPEVLHNLSVKVTYKSIMSKEARRQVVNSTSDTGMMTNNTIMGSTNTNTTTTTAATTTAATTTATATPTASTTNTATAATTGPVMRVKEIKELYDSDLILSHGVKLKWIRNRMIA